MQEFSAQRAVKVRCQMGWCCQQPLPLTHPCLPPPPHKSACLRREEASAQRAEKRALLGGPVLPGNLQRQLEASRFDEAGSQNATRFVGLQGSLANSYSNALLQVCSCTVTLGVQAFLG